MSVIVNKAKEQIVEAVKKAAESAMTSGALERAELCDFAIEIPSNRDHGDYEAALDAVNTNDIGKLYSSAYNIFEEVILPIHSTAQKQKELLLESGAEFCMMSGSGPAVFAFFKDHITATTPASAIRKFGARAIICETI